MKHWLCAILLISSICSAPLVRAAAIDEPDDTIRLDDEQAEESYFRKGFFVGVGPVVGYEFNTLTAFGGGITTQSGFRFSDHFSVITQLDFYFARDRGVEYFFFPIQTLLKFNAVDAFFGYVGLGYTYVNASSGPKFGSAIPTSSSSQSGFTAEAGFGSDIWAGQRFFVSPQVGFNYMRVSGADLYQPTFRLNFNWMLY